MAHICGVGLVVGVVVSFGTGNGAGAGPPFPVFGVPELLPVLLSLHGATALLPLHGVTALLPLHGVTALPFCGGGFTVGCVQGEGGVIPFATWP